MNKHAAFIKWTNDHPVIYWGSWVLLGVVLGVCVG